MRLDFFVNGEAVSLEVEPQRRLLDILREDLGLTGTKEGCAEGECGACTVMLDDLAVHSCLTLAAQLQGRHVTTIEGLEKNGELDILQRCFVEEIAVQCGFCTTGMIMSAKALLLKTPTPRPTRSAPPCRATSAAAPAMCRSSMPSAEPPTNWEVPNEYPFLHPKDHG